MMEPTTFRAQLGAWLELDLSGATADSLLHDDLGFDSLVMAEVSVFFADRGIELPDELLSELRTIGDLYHYAMVLGSGAAGAGDEAAAAAP